MASKWTNNGAGPIQCKRFNDAWSKLNWENNTFVELTGVIGLKESSSTMTSLFGGNVRQDVATVQNAIGEKFAWTVTKDNVNDVISAIMAELPTLQKNRPVKDKRRTPEAEQERNAKLNAIYAEQKAKDDAKTFGFRTHYGNGQTVTLQPGQMAVIAKVCFDNSDIMTDYFERHATLSQSFALLIVPKQAQTERLARRGLAVSPVLSAMEFDWHTENYSMGHGNYLESKGGFELPAELQNLRKQYGSDSGVTHAHWEISFTQAYSEPVTLDAIAGYGEKPSSESAPVSSDAVTVTENDKKDGIEIRFPSKPAPEVLENLKANGWRWSRFSQCWYARRTDRARQFAASLTAKDLKGDSEINSLRCPNSANNHAHCPHFGPGHACCYCGQHPRKETTEQNA